MFRPFVGEKQKINKKNPHIAQYLEGAQKRAWVRGYLSIYSSIFPLRAAFWYWLIHDHMTCKQTIVRFVVSAGATFFSGKCSLRFAHVVKS